MATFTRAPGALTEHVEGKAMVVRPDGSELLTLNPVGTIVWDELAAGADRAALVDAVARRFPAVERSRIERDVDAFLDQLLAAGLVVST